MILLKCSGNYCYRKDKCINYKNYQDEKYYKYIMSSECIKNDFIGFIKREGVSLSQ